MRSIKNSEDSQDKISEVANIAGMLSLVREILKVVERVNSEGVTILLVEQNVKHTLTIATRAYVLENGRIVMEGKGSDLLNNDHVKKAFLGI